MKYMNKLSMIVLILCLYSIIHLTMINPYKMIPIDCIIIYVLHKMNYLYDFINEKEYILNKRDKRDVLHNY